MVYNLLVIKVDYVGNKWTPNFEFTVHIKTPTYIFILLLYFRVSYFWREYIKFLLLFFFPLGNLYVMDFCEIILPDD